MFALDIIADQSRQNLTEVPSEILHMYNLKMLYLEGNFISSLPDDFFLKLHQLTWLDLRNNQLTHIPATIAHHKNLENLLLSKNRIERLPNEVGLVPTLKVLQIADNPLVYPSSKIIARGTYTVCSYLKQQYEKEEAQQEEEREEVQKVLDYRTLPNEARTCIIKNSNVQKAYGDDQRITHKISRDSSKVSLKSYLNSSSNVSLKNARLRQGWMEKLRTLLTEQERILQQEKNLRALNSWKIEMKSEPTRPVEEITEPPFGTYPEYSRMLSREDLTKQIDDLICKKSKPKPVDMEQTVNNLMSQVRKLEINYNQANTPRTEMDEAGKQIKLVDHGHTKEITTTTIKELLTESKSINSSILIIIHTTTQCYIVVLYFVCIIVLK